MTVASIPQQSVPSLGEQQSGERFMLAAIMGFLALGAATGIWL